MNNYWKKRLKAEMLERQKNDTNIGDEMSRLYNHHMTNIEKEIESFYSKYAKDNNISVSDAKKRAKELDVQAFSDKAKRYVKEKNFSAQANAELKLYNLKMKVSRLELLQYNMDLEMVALSEGERQLTEHFLNEEIIKELELQQGILGESLPSPAVIKDMAQGIINVPYQGAVWSDRIWERQNALRNIVASMAETTILRGRSALTLIPDIRREFNVSKSEAKRLAVTETARVQTEVQKENMTRNGYDSYEFIAEPTACPICAALDGKVFKVKDMAPGKNAAPIHPHCHCSAAPTVDRDELEKMFKEIEEMKQQTLNQARKHGDFINITDQAIDKVRMVDIPGYSKVELRNIQMAHKELLKIARDENNSNEVMRILTGSNPITVFGNENLVDINDNDTARFILNSAKDKTLTVIHNHPGGSSFSMNDINFFMEVSSVKTLTIVSNQGKVMYLTKTEKFNIDKIKHDINNAILPEDENRMIEMLVKIFYNNGIKGRIK